MKTLIILIAALMLNLTAAAAIKIDGPMTQNMDDVHSLGVIYINHNTAGGTPPEVEQANTGETAGHIAPDAESGL